MTEKTIVCECGHTFQHAMHYSNHQRRGCLGSDPTIEDLYRIGNVTREGDCIVWNGKRRGGSHQYGILPSIAIAQLVVDRASRAAVMLDTGSAIPEGMNVLHHCDNPPCINPEHLYLGTQKDNARDMTIRNRAGGRYEKDLTRLVHARQCMHCGKHFTTFVNDKRKTCGEKSCKSKHSWITKPKRATKPAETYEQTCPICGTVRERRTSSRAKTCGEDSCRTAMAWRTRTKI